MLLTIDKWELAQVGTPDQPQEKPVLYFRGKQKGLVLNKTNGNAIAELHGEEMDDWPGKEITIFPTTTEYKGKRADCIRIKMPEPLVSDDDPDMPF